MQHSQIPFKPRSPNIIRASEIGTFLYCQRAWNYQREGESSSSQPEMLTGTAMHVQHGRTVFMAGVLRGLAYSLLLVGLVLATVYVLNQLFS